MNRSPVFSLFIMFHFQFFSHVWMDQATKTITLRYYHISLIHYKYAFKQSPLLTILLFLLVVGSCVIKAIRFQCCVLLFIFLVVVLCVWLLSFAGAYSYDPVHLCVLGWFCLGYVGLDIFGIGCFKAEA